MKKLGRCAEGKQEGEVIRSIALMNGSTLEEVESVKKRPCAEDVIDSKQRIAHPYCTHPFFFFREHRLALQLHQAGSS